MESPDGGFQRGVGLLHIGEEDGSVFSGISSSVTHQLQIYPEFLAEQL